MAEPYDAKKVKEIAEDLQKLPGFTERNNDIRERRMIRFREWAVNHPRIGPRLEVRSPLADQHATRYALRLDVARLGLDVTPKSLDDEDAAQRTKQYWMRGYVELNRKPVKNPSLKVLDRVSSLGVGWYRQRLDATLLDRVEIDSNGKITGGLDAEKGVIGIPFVLETPDPMTMYYRRDFSEVAEIGYLESGGVAAMSEEQGRRGWGDVEQVIRLETKAYTYDLTWKGDDSKFVVNPNVFQRPAYYPVPARITDPDNPAQEFQPLIAELYPLVKLKNLYDTLLNNAADLTGAPLFYLKKGADPSNPKNWTIRPKSTRQEMKIDTGTGKVDVPEGYEPQALSLSAGIDLVRAIENLRIDIAHAGFPAVLGVPQAVEASSGWDRSLMEKATEFYITPTLSTHAAAWKEIFLGQAEVLKLLGARVTIRTIHQEGERQWFDPVVKTAPPQEVTTEPDDFVDIDLEVRFSSTTKEMRIAIQEELIRLLDHNPPLISVEEFLEQGRGVEDVERAVELIHRDQRRRVQMETAEAYLRATLAQKFGEETATPTAERQTRQTRRRPPKGEALPGVGATRNQPGPPRTPPAGAGPPPLGGMQGVA